MFKVRLKEHVNASIGTTFTAPRKDWLRNAVLFCLSIVLFIWLVSSYIYISLQGEVSANDSRSQEIADILRASLAAQKNLQLSLLLKKDTDKKVYVVVWPPYESPKRFECGAFTSNNLESLKIKHPYSDNFFMLTSFDLYGILTDIATVYNKPTVFCNNQPLTCIPLEKAHLNVTANPKGQCYTLVNK